MFMSWLLAFFLTGIAQSSLLEVDQLKARGKHARLSVILREVITWLCSIELVVGTNECSPRQLNAL